MNQNETWKPVPGYEGLYSASDLGRLIHHASYGNRFIGVQTKKVNRYVIVQLLKDGVRKSVTLHSLILMAHVGPRPTGAHANHKNGTKNDNRLENLEWVTRAENFAHAKANGHTFDRTNEPVLRPVLDRFTPAQISEIKTTVGQTQRLALKYGCSEHMIRRVRAS